MNVERQMEDCKCGDCADCTIATLSAECKDWRALHELSCHLVIPGETDSADAYRAIWFKMKCERDQALDKLQHEISEDGYKNKSLRQQLASAKEFIQQIAEGSFKDGANLAALRRLARLKAMEAD